MTTKQKTQPKKKPAKPTRAEQEYAKLQHEADVRIQHLRSVLKDVTRVYVANTEQKLIEIADKIGASSPASKGKGIQSGRLAQIIEALDAVHIKHEKGRRKDLKKIELLIDAINRNIPAEEA
jgi:hypothetical protein